MSGLRPDTKITLIIWGVVLVITLIILLFTRCPRFVDTREKAWSAACQHNLKETAVGIMAYREETGNYPDNLEQMEEFLNKKFGSVESSIYCPAKGGITKFTYHKPPENASPDFIVL